MPETNKQMFHSLKLTELNYTEAHCNQKIKISMRIELLSRCTSVKKKHKIMSEAFKIFKIRS